MDEINEPGKYLRRSKENVEAELPIPPKGGNTMLTTCLVLEAMAVIAFVMALVAYTGSLPPWLNLGTSKAMYVALRAAAFAGILAFLHIGVRACQAGIHRSRGWVQRMGWGALIITVVVLTLAAFMLLIFFSLANY